VGKTHGRREACVRQYANKHSGPNVRANDDDLRQVDRVGLAKHREGVLQLVDNGNDVLHVCRLHKEKNDVAFFFLI